MLIRGDSHILNHPARCRLCGHGCGVNRPAGETGRCGAGARARVAAHLLHHGEEPPISGDKGSGTIFFSGCPLGCVFCQNHQISQNMTGQDVSPEEMAGMMLRLRDLGAHNINLVSPTPYVPQIAIALELAVNDGLDLPVVYNTGGFDSMAALRIMDGLVDVYLPDAKFDRDESAARFCGAANYTAVNRRALKEMHRQVGPLSINASGTARRGVLIRHLVLPGHTDSSVNILKWLKNEFGPDVWLSLMAQYLPCHLVRKQPSRYHEIARTLDESEYDGLLDTAIQLGLENVFVQDLSSPQTYVPDFDSAEVFQLTK